MALLCAAPTDRGDGPSPLRVVIVDDHGPMRELLAELLTARGCSVVGEAENGREAVELVDRVACDVVVLDYRMPVMNGLEATRRLARRRPDLHLVAFSSDGDRGLVDLLLAAGAQAHFFKENVDGLIRYLAVLVQNR
jgi:DNA-binding NarL/FixJ family response regulator